MVVHPDDRGFEAVGGSSGGGDESVGEGVELLPERDTDRRQVLRERGPRVPGRLLGYLGDVAAVQSADRDAGDLGVAHAVRELEVVSRDSLEDRLRVPDEIHLVHRQHQAFNAKAREQVSVATRLRIDAGPGVNEHHGKVGLRRDGYRVGRVVFLAKVGCSKCSATGKARRAEGGGERGYSTSSAAASDHAQQGSAFLNPRNTRTRGADHVKQRHQTTLSRTRSTRW